jgi:hypothetical protein
MMLVGSSVFERSDGEEINKLLMQIVKLGNFINTESKWNGFNILHKVRYSFTLGIRKRWSP